MKIPFTKMNGAGNDFVMIDNRSQKIRLNKKQVSRLCNRQQGIGADGLILLESFKDKEKADFRMIYYNADGSEAELCGNGTRCFAKFVQEAARWKKKSLRFMMHDEVIETTFVGSKIRTLYPMPSPADLNLLLKLNEGTFRAHYICVPNPHVIVFVDDVENSDVTGLGRQIRYHEHFAPKGTNAHFVQILGKGKIRIRSYERGVEAETLACGTGMVASGLITHLIHGDNSPISIKVQGGDTLTLTFKKNEDGFKDVHLLGSAVTTFCGQIEI
jgi:diaminopimelate epimerase